MTGIIYSATNRINGKVYIGQTTKSLRKRMVNHWSDAVRNKEKCTYLEKALRKYGREGFEWKTLRRIKVLNPVFITKLPIDQAEEQIHEILPAFLRLAIKKSLNIQEQMLIKQCDSMNPNKGYNLTAGGEGTIGCHSGKGRKHSKEWNEKISKSHIGIRPTAESRKKNSESKKGKPSNLTDEQRRAIGEKLKGNKHLLGYRPNEKTRQKQSKSQKRVWADPDYRKKRAGNHKWKKYNFSDEQRAQISQMRRNGMTLEDIANKYNVCKKVIRQRCKTWNVVPNKSQPPCENCGNPIPSGNKKYCSSICYRKHQRADPNARRPLTILHCKNCHKTFSYRYGKRVFCSRSCAMEHINNSKSS